MKAKREATIDDSPRRVTRRNIRRVTGRRSRRGATIFLMIVAIIAILITAAFSVDIAYMQLSRTQLRSATDAATRAASATLSRTQNEALARQAAKTAASQNLVAGAPLRLSDADIIFGKATENQNGSWDFQAKKKPYNAVHVVGDRTSDSLSGGVNLFFGKMFAHGKFEPTMTATAVQMNRDIAIVVDRSGSMNATDVGLGLSRWQALYNSIDAFLLTLGQTDQDEQFALASYSSAAQIDVKLTKHPPNIMNALSRLPVSGATNIGGGIDQGIVLLDDPQLHRIAAVKTMILMTDGLHNTGIDPLAAAQRAVQSGIVIHTITFSPAADQPRMVAVAAITGGQHFHADTAVDLTAIFRTIAKGTPVLMTE